MTNLAHKNSAILSLESKISINNVQVQIHVQLCEI